METKKPSFVGMVLIFWFEFNLAPQDIESGIGRCRQADM